MSVSDKRRRRVERGALLVERDFGEAGADADLAGVWRKTAGQKVEQGRLASAVRPDDAQSVAPHHAKREIAHHR